MAKKGTVSDRFKAMTPAAQIFSAGDVNTSSTENIDNNFMKTIENKGENYKSPIKDIGKGNKKKQLNAMLPEEQIFILREAARLTNRTMTQVIGDLIMDKYRNEWKDMFEEMNQYK